MRRYIILLLAVTAYYRSSIAIPNTSIRLFDMDFIRVDIVKDDGENSEEHEAKASSKEEEKVAIEDEHLEDDNLGLLKSGDAKLMREDSLQSSADYDFLEPIDLEEIPGDELLRIRKELGVLFEDIN